jgi:hypothetical protein
MVGTVVAQHDSALAVVVEGHAVRPIDVRFPNAASATTPMSLETGILRVARETLDALGNRPNHLRSFSLQTTLEGRCDYEVKGH